MSEDRVIVVTGATGIAAACAKRTGAGGVAVFTVLLRGRVRSTQPEEVRA